MELDDDLCICFHVSRRKVLNYLRIRQPQRAAQLSECQGAGTGCGWCRPFLEKLFLEYQRKGNPERLALPNAEQYAARRHEYRGE